MARNQVPPFNTPASLPCFPFLLFTGRSTSSSFLPTSRFHSFFFRSFVRSFRCTDRGFSGIRWEIGQLTGRSDTSIGSVSVDLFFLPRIFGRSRRVPSFRHRSRFFDRCWFLFFVRPFYRFFLPSFTGDETRCDGWNGTRPDRVALEPRLTCLLGFTGFY